MAFVDMHTFSRDFLHFDMSLLLLTLTLRGVSNKHCLLSLFSFQLEISFRDILIFLTTKRGETSVFFL